MAQTKAIEFPDSEFSVGFFKNLPKEVEERKRSKRTSYPWHQMTKKGAFITVPAARAASAKQSADNFAKKFNEDKAKAKDGERIAFSMVQAAEEDGTIPKHERTDKNGNIVTNSKGEPKLEADNYWIIRSL